MARGPGSTPRYNLVHAVSIQPALDKITEGGGKILLGFGKGLTNREIIQLHLLFARLRPTPARNVKSIAR